MSEWTLEPFIIAADDLEKSQYVIQGKLKEAWEAFSHSCLYPHLADLTHIYSTIVGIINSQETLKDEFPRILKQVDIDTGEVTYQDEEWSSREIQAVEKIMLWSLKYIQEVIEEGTTICEFVDENLELTEVGIVPSYRGEGYLFVPEVGVRTHVLNYAFSIFTEAPTRYRSLRTSLIKMIDGDPADISFSDLKLSLVEEREELPNPSVFGFRTSLDFSFESTILPIAKRKLMRYLVA